jgi:glycosyltransferase involved in cell wall biosynthesis
MKISNKRVAAICLTSQQSGWSDHFATIVYGIFETEWMPVIYTSTEAAKSFSTRPALNMLSFGYHKNNFLFSLLQILKIAKKINKGDFDLVLIYGESVQHMLLLFLIRKPIVSHIADPIPHQGEKWTAWIRSAVSQIPILLKAKKIFFASNDVIYQCKSRYPYLCNLSFVSNKFRAIRFANLIQFDGSDLSLKKYKEKKWDFIYFGRDEVYKGLEVLVKALEILQGDKIIPRLLLISKNFHRKKPLQGVTVVSEYLSHERLVELIGESKWGIFPYTDATGTHTVQICNRFGLPVLASNVGSFKEYIVDSINGSLVQPCSPLELAERIKSILDEKIDSLKGDDLIEWSKNFFSNKTSTRKLIEIFDETLSM